MTGSYWLLKSEPGEFSIDDLARAARQTAHWDGVRNYQARNFLRAMRRGEQAFFYHSACKTPAIVGVVRVVREAFADPSAIDPLSPYHDPASTPERTRWLAIDVQLDRALHRPITLTELRRHPALADMELLRRGSRLSVQPVTSAQWSFILAME